MYCSFDQNKNIIFSNKTNLAVNCRVLHSRRIAHMQKGAFQNTQELFQKATQMLLLCVALSRGCDQLQSRLRHVRVEPRVFCCGLLLALASTLHLAICGGCTVTRPHHEFSVTCVFDTALGALHHAIQNSHFHATRSCR